MRRDFLIGAALLAIVVIIAAIFFFLVFGLSATEIRTVTTDKELYHSGEIMNITADLSSSGQLDNATLRFEGITDRNGRDRLKHEIPASLSGGSNIIFYEYTLPSCSHCAGLDPGDYNITVILEVNGEVLDMENLSVRIEQ